MVSLLAQPKFGEKDGKLRSNFVIRENEEDMDLRALNDVLKSISRKKLLILI